MSTGSTNSTRRSPRSRRRRASGSPVETSMPPMRGIGSTCPPAERMRAATARAWAGEEVPTTIRASTPAGAAPSPAAGTARTRTTPRARRARAMGVPDRVGGSGHRANAPGVEVAPVVGPGSPRRIRAPGALAGSAPAADRGGEAPGKDSDAFAHPPCPAVPRRPRRDRPRRPSGARRRPRPCRWSTTSRRRCATSRPPRVPGCRCRPSAGCCARIPARAGSSIPSSAMRHFRVAKVSGTSLLPLSAEGMAGRSSGSRSTTRRSPTRPAWWASTRSATPGTTAA